MTTRKHLKKLVRARAAKTGETYAAALRHVRSQRTEKAVPDKPILVCSFCSKSQDEVKQLIAGPGVYICDECVVLCNEIVEEPVSDEARPPRPKPDRADVLLRILGAMVNRATKLERDMAAHVAKLRGLGTEWETIASAMGLDVDVARARFETGSPSRAEPRREQTSTQSAEITESKSLPPELDEMLKNLSERERSILTSRFGLDRGEPRTLAEVGAEFGETAEVIREIEARAMSKLRPKDDT